MADGPLGRAREALLKARADVEHSPSGANLKALEEAQAHMDFLLDTLPIPPTPSSPVPHRPGLEVSFNGTGQAEQVLTPDEVRAKEQQWADGDSSSGDGR